MQCAGIYVILIGLNQSLSLCSSLSSVSERILLTKLACEISRTHPHFAKRMANLRILIKGYGVPSITNLNSLLKFMYNDHNRSTSY